MGKFSKKITEEGFPKPEGNRWSMAAVRAWWDDNGAIRNGMFIFGATKSSNDEDD